MRSLWMSAAGLVVASSCVVSCSSAPAPPARVAPKHPALRVETPPKVTNAPPMLPAYVVAHLDDEDAAGYFARHGAEGVLLVSTNGRWKTRVLGADGAPKSEQLNDIGPAPEGIPMASLRAAGDGYIALWVEAVEKNSALKIVMLDAEGKPRGAPVLVAQSADELSFADVLPNAKGALVLWEVPHDGRYDVLVAPVEGGKPTRGPVMAARDVLGWEAVGTSRGAAIVAVTAPAKPKNAPADEGDSARLGRVTLTEIDAAGALAAPVVVSAEPTAHVDVGVVEAAGRYVVAWTDEREIDASVYLAAIDRGGKVSVAPHRAMAPVGEQAMVTLVAPRMEAGPAGTTGPAKGARPLLAWEDLRGSSGGDRLIHLAPVGDDAALAKDRATLVFSANGPPDLAADGEGYAAVTLAQAAPPSGDAPAPVWPVYVRLGADLSVLASEPVRAEPFHATGDGVPYLTRGLSCEAGSCTVLASGPGSPALLAVVSLPVRPSSWRAPAFRDGPATAPRMTALRALYDGDHLSRVAATTVGGTQTSLVAWVTYFLDGATGQAPGEKRGGEPLAATLAVRTIGEGGALGKTNVLSQRAHSIGGVSLASAPNGDTVMAWVARDKGKPQVFVTRLDAAGEKQAQKALTVIPRKDGTGLPSEAVEVSIAYAGPADAAKAKNEGEWIVAWSDTRDGNSEVYVSKVDRNLKKLVPDRRVTEAPGDSAEVQIAVRGADTFLVWSDARDSAEDGNADIYMARFETRSLKKAGDDTRLFASAGHSRTPSVAVTSSGIVVGWVEETTGDAPGDSGEGSAVRIAQIDDKGAVVGAPSLVATNGDAGATSVTLRCAAGASKCLGALTSVVGDNLAVGAFDFAPGSAPSPVKQLAGLSGGVTQDVSLSFASDAATSLFFADDAVGGTGRVRWMSVTW